MVVFDAFSVHLLYFRGGWDDNLPLPLLESNISDLLSLSSTLCLDALILAERFLTFDLENENGLFLEGKSSSGKLEQKWSWVLREKGTLPWVRCVVPHRLWTRLMVLWVSWNSQRAAHLEHNPEAGKETFAKLVRVSKSLHFWQECLEWLIWN